MRTLAGMSILVAFAVTGQELVLRTSDDQLQVSAPRLHFLTGRPLERIRSGSAVAYDFQLTVLDDARSAVLRRGFDRFVISYDLWEERFSVTSMRGKRATASHLSEKDAESWCLKNVELSIAGLSQDRRVVVRLEIRAQQPRERDQQPDESGLALSSLIDVFSRVAKEKPVDYWKVETDAFRIQDLRKSRGGV